MHPTPMLVVGALDGLGELEVINALFILHHVCKPLESQNCFGWKRPLRLSTAINPPLPFFAGAAVKQPAGHPWALGQYLKSLLRKLPFAPFVS